MKNKRNSLWILSLASLVWGTAAFSSYAKEKVVTIVKEQEVEITVPKEKKKKVKVVETRRRLRTATSEEAKFTGEASFEGLYNVGGVSYPKKTDFTPSLIITKASNQKNINAFDLNVKLKMGINKRFIFENEILNGKLEFKANKKEIKLSQVALTWDTWTIGITANKFGNIAAFPSAKVAQISWEKSINEMFTVGASIEEAERLKLFETATTGILVRTKRDKANIITVPAIFQHRRDLPAFSARVQYNLPNTLGAVEVSGLLRLMGWANRLKMDKTYLKSGYGVNVGSKINLKPETDILTFNLIFGEGIGEYIPDMAELKNEPTSIYLNTKGEATSIRVGGAYLTYEHHWNTSLRSIFAGGLTKILNINKKDRPDYYSLGAYGTFNVMYWLSEHASFGVEYGLGLRQNADEASKTANQVKVLLNFKI